MMISLSESADGKNPEYRIRRWFVPGKDDPLRLIFDMRSQASGVRRQDNESPSAQYRLKSLERSDRNPILNPVSCLRSSCQYIQQKSQQTLTWPWGSGFNNEVKTNRLARFLTSPD
jgi:hypothetical protein